LSGDSAETLRKKVQEAVQLNQPTKINFPRGATWRVNLDSDYLWTISNVSELAINGNGSKIEFTKIGMGLLRLFSSSNVLVRGLVIESVPAPYTLAKVLKIEAGSLVLESSPATLALDHETMLSKWTWGVLLDPNRLGVLKSGVPIVISTVKNSLLRSGGTLSLSLSSTTQAKYFEVGDRYLQFARTGSSSLMQSSDCSNVTAYDMTSYSTGAGHYLFLGGSDSRVILCRELIQTNAPFGGNADGVHCRSQDVGPWVENCTIEGIGDDGIVIYNKGTFILRKVSPDAVLVAGGELFNFKEGDEVDFFNPRLGEKLSGAKRVLSINKEEGGFKLRFSEPVDFVPYDGGANGSFSNDQIFNRSKNSPHFMIRGNNLRAIRRFGIIVRAQEGVIENNRVEDASSSGITFRNEPTMWRNGLASSSIIVRSNVLNRCGFDSSGGLSGSLSVLLDKIGYQPAQGGEHRNFLIEGNTILDYDRVGMRLESLDGAIIRNNLLVSTKKNFI
jgi:hypothetical protein